MPRRASSFEALIGRLLAISYLQLPKSSAAVTLDRYDMDDAVFLRYVKDNGEQVRKGDAISARARLTFIEWIGLQPIV